MAHSTAPSMAHSTAPTSFPIFHAPTHPSQLGQLGPPQPPPAHTPQSTVQNSGGPNSQPAVPLSPSSVIYARPTTTVGPTNFYNALQSPQPVTVQQLSLAGPGGPVVQSMAHIGLPNAPLLVQTAPLGPKSTTVNPTAQSGGTVSMPTTPSSVPPSPGLPAGVGTQAFTGRINLTISNGAINIKPAAALGQAGAVAKADGTLTSPPPGTVVRANLGQLQGKVPLNYQGPLSPSVLQNPVNIRLSTGNASISQAGRGASLVTPRGPIMVRPGGQVMQVTPQGNILQLQPTARLIPQVGAPQIISRLPIKPRQTPAKPNIPHLGNVTIPIQVAVPAQGTLATLTSLPQSIIQASSLAATPLTGPVMVTSLGQMDAVRTNTHSAGTVTVVTSAGQISATPICATDFSAVQAIQVTPTKTSVVGTPAGSPAISIGSDVMSPAQTPVKADTPSTPKTTAVTTTILQSVDSAKKEVTRVIGISPGETMKPGVISAAGKVSYVGPIQTDKKDSKNPAKLETPQSESKPDEATKNEVDKENGGKTEEKTEESGDKEEPFDAVGALEWDNGIGTLPGSDLKFKMNEFGCMEVIMDEDVTKDTKDKEEVAMETSETKDDESKEEEDKLTSGDKGDEDMGSDGIIRCENCGLYGMQTEFCNGGRFCSKVCVAVYASKQNKKQQDIKKSMAGKQTNVGLMAAAKKKKRRWSLLQSAPSSAGSTPEKTTAEPSTPPEGISPAKIARKEGSTEEKKPATVAVIPAKKTKGFSWSQYLEQEKATAAPSKLFKDPFPCSKNGFKVGMKCEGIDPRHPSQYCVMTVAEVKGYRLRMHFDGYSECYDFWTNADSPFLFPTGWSDKNNKKLNPPKGFSADEFAWGSYLKLSKSASAPKNLIVNNATATSVTPHGFRIGMKLEAVDKKNMALTCVATVVDVLGDRILIHFDGWEDSYDYWCDPSSPYVHPVGWCQESGKPLSPPNDWPDIEGFTWEEYLIKTKSSPVPARAFKNRPYHGFEVGMKVEAVDRRNPILIRVATVKETDSHRMLLHFDGWADMYDYWVDDDCCDIHPPGWCSKTNYPLQPPITGNEASNSPSQGGCPTPGCNGVGHIKGAKYTGHHSLFGCPYSIMNMNKEGSLTDRLGPTTLVRAESVDGRAYKVGDYNPSPDKNTKCPTAGCDGSGHVTGKYTAHHSISGCPLAIENQIGAPKSGKGDGPPTAIVSGATKPLFGPGSGRGRKKKILKALHEQQQMMLAKKESKSESSTLHLGIHQSVFMSAMVTSPSTKDLPLCWDQHTKLLPVVNKYSANDVMKWSSEQVAGFVNCLPGCSPHGKVFHDEQVDGEAFLLLTQADIVKVLNIKLGPALKIFNSIIMFKNNVEV